MTTAPLTLQVRSLRADLKPALGRVADLVTDSPGRVAGMTIGELAREAGCSEATVVRFAHVVGCSGYRDLRFQLHEEAVADQQRVTSGAEQSDIDPADDLETMTTKIAAADARAVRDTVRGLDLRALTRVADAIAQAGRTNLYGVGASALPALDAQQKFTRVGLPASAYTEPHNGLPAAALLGTGDVAMLFSYSGRTAEILDAARLAHDAGARVAAVTGSAASPLARMADDVLLISAVESELRSGATASRIAQLTALDCVFVAVVTRLPDLGREALIRTRNAVEDRRTV